MLYQAQLKSTVDPNHVSDWCVGDGRSQAKARALANYQTKYPNDNIADTVYEVKPAIDKNL